jgi:hypothetical protein
MSNIENGITLQWLNEQISRAGFTPSNCGWQDSDGHAYACSVESTYVDGNGSHPDFEASWNPSTRWLQIGKDRRLVASNITMGWLPVESRF